ncbi:MAG: hypothetical protein U9P36_02105 [Thermodesulfobacteriota bacterium]|nr:hypothetical protein [Thermodesulfobacteriota bacterium]
MDGRKMMFQDGSRLMIRSSGTEPKSGFMLKREIRTKSIY